MFTYLIMFSTTKGRRLLYLGNVNCILPFVSRKHNYVYSKIMFSTTKGTPFTYVVVFYNKG